MAQTATQEIRQNDKPNEISPESQVIPVFTRGSKLAASVRLHHADVAQQDHETLIENASPISYKILVPRSPDISDGIFKRSQTDPGLLFGAGNRSKAARKKRYLQTLYEFDNPAFQADATYDKRTADVVHSLAISSIPIHEDIHPYGRGHLYEVAFYGRKFRIQAGGGKIMLWIGVVLLIMGVGLIIIFRSELYVPPQTQSLLNSTSASG